MYKVYADDVLIHDNQSPNKNVHLIDPNLDMEDNAAGSMTFTMLPSNVGYDIIDRMSTTIKVTRDNKTIWLGRVINQTEDFWHRRKYTCEGALAFLNDSIQELYVYTNMDMLHFVVKLLEIHNSKVQASRKINIGTVTVSDMNDQHEYRTNYQTTLDAFINEVFNRLGGHIRLRFVENDPIPRLDYLASYPKTATQEINFGNNLLDFTKNWDLSELTTVILPRGKQLESEDDSESDYVTIETINQNSKYLANDEACARFGRIETVVDFPDVDDKYLLKSLAINYLSVLQFDNMTLTVSAIDLHTLDRSNANIKSFDLLDEVRCISRPHGMNRLFPITKISIPLNDPSGIKYTMGAVVPTSLSSISAASNKNFLSLIDNIPSFTNLLDVAKANATQILNSATTGYINIIVENDTSQALVITDNPNMENATKMWKFNMNGLGYSSNGGSLYDLAITMDGTIVADFIKTGLLSDGYGLNYWNLSTGEFSLAYNTKFMNSSGNDINVVDIVSLAQNSYGAASTAQSNANKALKKQSGTDNILNGTNKLLKLITGSSSWADGTWDGQNGTAATKTVINVTGAPNPNVVKGIQIRAINSSTEASTQIAQRNVELSERQIYTMSCYARGTGKLQLIAGKNIQGASMHSVTVSDNLTESWRRYSFGFRTGYNNAYSDNGDAGMVSGKVDIFFGIVGNQQNVAQLCGFKLERGNAATDWTESTKDAYSSSTNDSNSYTNKASAANKNYTDSTKTILLNNDDKIKNVATNYTDKVSTTNRAYTHEKTETVKTYGKNYTDKISQADRAFTSAQRVALDESYTQAKIFNRLTNNGSVKGLWLSGGQLYVNANYITTGVLNAGIIQTGILMDQEGNNKWNLATGYFTTKNMEITNMNATGALTCATQYTHLRVDVRNGGLYFYAGTNNKYMGTLNVGTVYKYGANGRGASSDSYEVESALRITTPDDKPFVIQCRELRVEHAWDRKRNAYSGGRGFTGEIPVVAIINNRKKFAILYFANGICTGYDTADYLNYTI